MQCLGILLNGPASGYEIKKKIEDGPYCHFLEASFASIYPALSRLTANFMVTVETKAQSNRPDKKVYAVTEEGRAAFVEALSAPQGDDKFRSPWLYAMYFSDLLPKARIQQMVKERIAYCERQIASINGSMRYTAEAGPAFVAQLGIEVFEAELACLKRFGGSISAQPPRTERLTNTAEYQPSFVK